MTKNIKHELETKKKYFPTFINLKQREIIRITTNSNEYVLLINFNINKDFEGFQNFFLINSGEQKDFMVTIKSFRFLEFPYESKCSYYNSKKTLFNSTSHKHCVRQCILYNCEKVMTCSCFTFKYSVNQMDYGFHNLEPCQTIDSIIEKKIRNIL